MLLVPEKSILLPLTNAGWSLRNNINSASVLSGQYMSLTLIGLIIPCSRLINVGLIPRFWEACGDKLTLVLEEEEEVLLMGALPA